MTDSPPASIDTLLSTGAYNPSIQAALEAHVASQKSNASPYHYAANKTLLNHYQFFPTLSNPTTCADVLLLSLSHSPPDFLPLSHIADLSSPPAEAAGDLAALLESCSFEAFWSRAEEEKELLQSFPGFEDRVRAGIAATMSKVYQSSPLPLTLLSLNLPASSIASFASSSPVISSVTSTEVVFSPNEENQPRPGRPKEVIGARCMADF